MLNIRQSLKFSFFLVFAFLLISIQKVNAAALACNANEIAQTFTFGGGNAWTGGSSTNNYTVGTAPNAVTLTFTNTQVSTAIAGDPSLRQAGNNANALVISGTNSPVGATLSTLALSTNRTINKLTYNVYDMDYDTAAGSNFRDRIVATRNSGAFPTAMTPVTPANETITLATGNAVATTSANCAATDTGCNIEIQFNTTGISSTSTQFLAAHASGTTAQQSIGFGEYSWCLPRHPTVTIRKVSNGSTGAFTFTNTNLASGTTNLTTATAGVAVSSAAINVASLSSNVQIQEAVPSGWELSSASCTDANGTLTTNGTGTFGSLAGNTLTIPTANLVYGADIRCTFTNRKTSQLTLRKTWTNAKVNDAVNITTSGGTVNPSFAAVANTASETDTGTAATVYAGETLTFAESFTTGASSNYNSSLACTGATDTNLANGLTINAADSNIVCTYTNSRIAQSVRVNKQWVNSVTGHTATVTTTGGTNNPTFSSIAPINTTGTAVTVYAGDVLTLPAETFGGGGTAIGHNITLACTGGSPLASGTTGRTLTISNSATATVCTYTNTKLPTITITKVSNGGVRAFDFAGNNGFANQTITTVSSGVGVAGATQRLAAAGFPTTITETVSYGYALTNVACTGLGTGTATVNYTTATVTLDTNATAAANNIACTFTNTAYGTTPSDPLLKTTRFSAVPDIPTIPRGLSGTQTIVMTNNGPDNATGVVTYYRPLVATGVTVTAVSSPAGACVFSSPDWVCPAIASVLNGASYNITVTYSTTSASSLGIAKQGEIRVNSNEYTECGGVNEYKYNVWGLGGTSQPQPAPTNSAFWVGNTNTTTTATPSGAYSTESTDIFQAWPTTQDYPTGSYLYSPVAGRANNVYSPSSTIPNPTVSKVLTGLNGQPENNVVLPQFGSTGTFTGDNKRAWEGQTCIYVPVATTITPCLMMFDDAAYIRAC